MTKKPKKRSDEVQRPITIAPLGDDALARVTGGEGTTPRDPATGMPTGKRQ